jgi:hypothetical protein
MIALASLIKFTSTTTARKFNLGLSAMLSTGTLSSSRCIMANLTLTDMAAAIRAEHLAARGTFRKAVEHAVNAGNLLIDAKKKFPHGQWLPWVEANCDLSERSAQGYMSLARRWDMMTEKRRDEVALLGLRGALKETAQKRQPPAKQQLTDVSTLRAETVNEPHCETIDVDFDVVKVDTGSELEVAADNPVMATPTPTNPPLERPVQKKGSMLLCLETRLDGIYQHLYTYFPEFWTAERGAVVKAVHAIVDEFEADVIASLNAEVIERHKIGGGE